MPNHIHLLVQPWRDLATIIVGWKSYTARWALQQDQRLDLKLPESNRLWMREYWDRCIRDEEHYQNTVSDIHFNLVKAELCESSTDWPWSSACPGSADGRSSSRQG